MLNTKGRLPIITAGDFNAWTLELGNRTTDLYGCVLLEMFVEPRVAHEFLDLIHIQGKGPIVDLT